MKEEEENGMEREGEPGGAWKKSHREYMEADVKIQFCVFTSSYEYSYRMDVYSALYA